MRASSSARQATHAQAILETWPCLSSSYCARLLRIAKPGPPTASLALTTHARHAGPTTGPHTAAGTMPCRPPPSPHPAAAFPPHAGPPPSPYRVTTSTQHWRPWHTAAACHTQPPQYDAVPHRAPPCSPKHANPAAPQSASSTPPSSQRHRPHAATPERH